MNLAKPTLPGWVVNNYRLALRNESMSDFHRLSIVTMQAVLQAYASILFTLVNRLLYTCTIDITITLRLVFPSIYIWLSI